MDVDKTIKELSLNEKKVLLALKKLHGKGSPEDIFKNGQFSQDVEVSNAASWLQSKKLVTMDNHIKTVYSLGKEGKRFVEKGLPEKRALKLLSDRKGTITLKDLSAVLDSDEISVAIGWLKTNGWASIRKEKDTIVEMTDKGKKALSEVTDVEKLLRLLHEHPEQEIEKDSIKPLASRKNVIKEKELITSTIILTDNGKKVVETGFEIQEEISQVTSAVIKNSEW
ncbi:MAG: phenylalanine--tRNA ligase subunit alpha, partial [Euryarchaeota archaeon]|nr:phenylalanine--tRNA ligase subunit alpha [Euryarchaeota archaeon]